MGKSDPPANFSQASTPGCYHGAAIHCMCLTDGVLSHRRSMQHWCGNLKPQPKWDSLLPKCPPNLISLTNWAAQFGTGRKHNTISCKLSAVWPTHLSASLVLQPMILWYYLLAVTTSVTPGLSASCFNMLQHVWPCAYLWSKSHRPTSPTLSIHFMVPAAAGGGGVLLATPVIYQLYSLFGWSFVCK